MITTLLRTRFSVAAQQLMWREKNEMLEFLVFDAESQGKTIYLIDNEITFQDLKQRHIFQEYDFKLPKGVDETIPVATILAREERPIQIQVSFQGEQYLLKNRFAEPDQQSIVRTLLSPKSIYKHYEQVESISEHRKTLTGFYLRLQTEAYLKSAGISSKSKLSPEVKSDILSYLGSVNQVPSQVEISKLMESEEAIAMKMAQTQHQIDIVEQEADRLLGVYRAISIGLTAAHLGSFGYMIFAVDWLGWDIIEPLTFSVGSLYTLLGLRFYRKFQKDRKQENVREALRNWALKPSKRIELNQLKMKLTHEQSQFKINALKVKLQTNRLVPLSVLPADM